MAWDTRVSEQVRRRAVHWVGLLLTGVGAGICWWPAMVEPSIDFPRWILLAIAAGLTASAVPLFGKWKLAVAACSAGTVAGLCSGAVLFPSSDWIAESYILPFVLVASVVMGLVSLVTTLIVRKVPGTRLVGLVWGVWIGCVVFGPLMLAVTPVWVGRRVARNNEIAAERFVALKHALERTLDETQSPSSFCDRSLLRLRYSGPPFSDDEWRRIIGNYVTRDGYRFMVFCHEKNGYTLDVVPLGGKGAGTRGFCTDESRRTGCEVEWNRSRYVCQPCAEATPR